MIPCPSRDESNHCTLGSDRLHHGVESSLRILADKPVTLATLGQQATHNHIKFLQGKYDHM